VPSLDIILENTLCEGSNNYFNNSDGCNSFAHTIASKGLHLLVCYDVETSKQVLFSYNFANFTQSLQYLNGDLLSDISIFTSRN